MSRSYVYKLTVGIVIWRILIRLAAMIAIGAVLPMIPEDITPVTNVLLLVAVAAMLITLVRPGMVTNSSLRRREQVVKALGNSDNAAAHPRLTNNMELRQLFASSYKPAFAAAGDKWRYADMLYKAPANRFLPLLNLDIEETRYTSVLEVQLPRELPAMLFKNKQRRGTYRFVNQSQRTSLDVNFDDYFVTYFPHHYHIDARSIISPEVMAAMVDMPGCDIEINGSSLFFYPGYLPDNEIAAFIEKAMRLEQVLADHIVHYRDELLDDTSDRQSVSAAGKSLRQSSVLWLLAAIVFFVLSAFFFMLWLQSDSDDMWRKIPLEDAKYGVILLLLGFASLLQSFSVNKANRQKDRHHQEQRRKIDS